MKAFRFALLLETIIHKKIRYMSLLLTLIAYAQFMTHGSPDNRKSMKVYLHVVWILVKTLRIFFRNDLL